MLSRAGSNASSNNLRRSKSSTSVKDRRKHPLPSEPLDPETSRLHALIAAHRAMDRSHHSDSQSRLSPGGRTVQRSNTQRTGHSVHFSPGSEARTKVSNRQSAVSTGTHATMAEHTRTGTYSYEDSLLSSDFGGMGETYGAQPSSYRRLGRAKSMIITSRRSRQYLSSGTSETSFSQAPTLRNAVSSISLREPGLKLRLKRSLSILRPTSRRTTAPSQSQLEQSCRPESIELARKQFLEEANQPQIKKKVSQIFQSRIKRQQKAFRQSLRPDLLHGSVVSISTSPDRIAPPVRKKDSISSLLRSRFMKSLSKRNNDSAPIPPQQLSATRDYSGTHGVGSTTETGFDSYHEVDSDVRGRSSIYVPSHPHPESCEDVDSLSQKLRASASFESLGSKSRSRVTSWTNSTITTSTRGPLHENNRLSIIKEDGSPHHPSCSAGRHISGVSTIQQPMPGFVINGVDSQRLYSALMKRIDQEQAEMDRTQVSLAKIHEEEEHNRTASNKFPNSTIRTVESRTSSAVHDNTSEAGSNDLKSSSLSDRRSADEAENATINIMRPSNRVPQTDVQATFFPFSTEAKSHNPSPFRNVLTERHHQRGNSLHEDVVNDNASVIVRRKVSSLSRSKFGKSSESVYSRNTDGGTNMDYVSPVGSTDDFMPNPLHGYQDTGMATIMFSTNRDSNARIPTASSATASEKINWRGWVENQMASFTRHESKTSKHIRENAHIGSPEPTSASIDTGEPDKRSTSGYRAADTGKITQPSISSSAVDDTNGFWRPANSSIPADDQEQRDSSPDQLSIDHTSHPQRKASFTNAHRNTSGDSQLLQKYETKTSTLRKISSVNISKMLKGRKSQPVLPFQSDAGKENKPGSGFITTPVSTPGRYQLQMRSGNSTGRLRESVSAAKDEKVGSNIFDLADLKSAVNHAVNESPSDRFKNALSARLSRPFDMDVPEFNRPFDSMYLGKRTPGFAEIMRGDRLSIAPKAHQVRPHKSYGGLGPPRSFNIEDDKFDETEATALPAIPDVDNGSRSTSLTQIAMSGKRVVSNFLKSRRKDTDHNDDVTTVGSPAFL